MTGRSGDVVKSLFARSGVRRLLPGEALFRQGDPATHLYLIEAGAVHMVRHTWGGERIPIHAGEAGQLFAEGALFADAYGCDAVAADNGAVVRACSKTVVMDAAREQPGLLFNLLAGITRQLHRARMLIELRSVRSAEDRVLRHLHLQAEAAGEVTFASSYAQAARDLGLTPEAYYRTLAKLEREGMIRREGRVVRLAAARA